MQNVLLFFVRFGAFISFIFLQLICFLLIVNFNKGHKEIFLHSSSFYSNIIDGRFNQWTSYISLQETNDSLSNHNAHLMELFINTKDVVTTIDNDSLQYKLISARIVKNTFQLHNNHISLDKGKIDGIKKDMGVISEVGLLGIVKNVSDHYTHAVSILNSQTKISCTVRPFAYPGSLSWQNSGARHMVLSAIPKHVKISIGDTVVTNGYSTIFPKDLIVGTIETFSINKGSSDYKIIVKLINDVQNSKVGYVINNRLAKEQKMIENLENE
ncbi:MAG: rod shape-determining protein MreC [Saprospiraceae bacterium]